MYNELVFLSKLFNMKGFNCIDVCTGIMLMCIVASVSSRALHEDMTPAELVRTFERVDNLPEYQVLPIRYSHIDKRAVNGHVELQLKPFGEHIKLWLEPTDGVLFSDDMPIYFLSSDVRGRLQYGSMKDGMKSLAPWIYKNYETFTTLSVNRDGTRAKRMVGVIGSKDLVIRPIPARLVADVTRQRRSLDNIPESEYDDHHYHIVYKSSASQSVEPLTRSLRERRSNQDTVYPEILVLADHHLYKVFEEQWEDMIMYLMAFWNGVDMMFRALESPRYRFHISAIFIAEDDNALSYISNNRIGKGHLEFTNALNMSQTWLFDHLPQSFKLDSFDLAATMTSLKSCELTDDEAKCKERILGIAYLYGACKMDERFRRVAKTALIGDNGAFSGINTAGHELGHAFGANHDGEESNVRCSGKRGNIMAAQTSLTENFADWSDCSLKQMSAYLEVNGTCLYNKPKSGVKLTRLLPGRMKDADEQCKHKTGTKAGYLDETICQTLYCVKKDNPTQLITTGAAADGTKCDEGKMCLHGKCIAESMITY